MEYMDGVDVVKWGRMMEVAIELAISFGVPPVDAVARAWAVSSERYGVLLDEFHYNVVRLKGLVE